MSLGTILLIVLILLLVGAIPSWSHSRSWGYGPSGIVGVVAPSARDGILQDVHWSSGLFGYFPSYTIGNLYAASLGATLVKELPDLWDRVAQGDFAPILTWLRERIHSRGHTQDAPRIFKDAVGDRDPVEDLMAHLWSRQGKLYGVSR